MNNRIYDKAIVDELARELSIPLPLAKHSADEILAIVREGLMRDGAVTITNLGTFRLKPVTARMGFNPNTRERISIPAHQRVVFTPAKALRDAAEPPRLPAVPVVAEEKTLATPQREIATLSTDVQFEIKPQPVPEIIPPPPAANILALAVAGAPSEPQLASPAPIVSDVSSSLPEIRFDQEPASPAPLVQESVAVPYTPVNVAQAPQPVPAAALRMTTNNSWATRAPVIATIKPPHETSNRKYVLGAVAALLVGGYIAYLLNSPQSVLNTPTAPAAVAETAAAATETNFFFKEQQYRIVPGDSLWRIADVHYQQAVLWPHIYRANTTVIKNPDFLANGLTITIPGLEGPPDNLSENDRRNIAQGYFIAYLYYKTTGHKDTDSALIMAKLYDASAVDQVSMAQ